jgi:hypothetical protein
VVLQGRAYADCGLGESTGFYDWLRNAQGEVVGVRYWPFELTSFVLDECRERDYAVVHPGRCVEIYFFGSDQADDLRSADQAFLISAVLREPDGRYALLFGTEDLAPTDLRRLEDQSSV